MSRNKQLNQIIKDERREQIVSTALKLFATKGMAATRMADIALATGTSQGLVYHYFRSKEELFLELVSTAVEKMNVAALNLEILPNPAKEKLIMAVEALLKGFNENADTVNYYFLITQTALSDMFPEKAKEVILTQNNIKYQVISRILKQGQSEGTVKNYDVQEMTTMFFSSINGLALNKAINGPKFQMPDKKIILSMFLK